MQEPVLSVNLWCALTSCERQHSKDQYGPGPRVTVDFIRELGRIGRFHMSEFGIRPSEDGWIIEIFGCDIDDHGKIEILIPKDRKEAVKVLKDEIGARVYKHQQNI